ncbi:hypothetical protein KY332_02755 [Candidatus Woesearchaeota archaeon]|nr:hypothetical protein [Candidatus Woesearchaeota archaeon]
MKTIILVILAIIIALVLLKFTKKLIHTAFFLAVVGVVFFVLKYLIAK